MQRGGLLIRSRLTAPEWRLRIPSIVSNTAYTLKLIAGDDKVQPVSFSVAAWGEGNGKDGEKKETD